MACRRTSIHSHAKPRPVECGVYAAVISYYQLTADTEPHVIAATQRRDVVAAWEMFRDLGHVSEAVMLPVSVCKRRLIEAGEIEPDTRNRYYMPRMEAT